MRRFLVMSLALLLGGCDLNEPADPEGQGAWLTLGRNGVASAFIRFDSGETEKWTAPFTTRFVGDGQSLEIILKTERCGDMQFLSVLGSDELKRISNSPVAGRALPCRLNSADAPRWTLLTKVVNSKQE